MVEPAEQDVPRHPIGVVTARTGLSSHVLRAWERRYGVVQPGRGATGRRLYSDAEVERLALLSSATRSGRPVASVVSLDTKALRALVADDAEHARQGPPPAAWHREQAMLAARALEPERLERLLRRALLALGTVGFLADVLAPLLAEIGSEWNAGQIGIAEEHAATATISQLLGRLVRDLELPEAQPRLLLATPQGERHSLGALMAAAVAAHDGWRVTWLGADLPAAEIATAARQGRAHVVALSVATMADGLETEIAALRRELAPHVWVVVGGAGAASLGESAGLSCVRDLAHWRSLLRMHAARGGE